MKRFLILAFLAITGCSALPEEGPETVKFSGELVFPQTTALAEGSVAHVKVIPTTGPSVSKPILEVEVPAKTGDTVPFSKRAPAKQMRQAGECIVLAQIIDHGRVTWSNLSSPLRMSFVAEPVAVRIPVRPE